MHKFLSRVKIYCKNIEANEVEISVLDELHSHSGYWCFQGLNICLAFHPVSATYKLCDLVHIDEAFSDLDSPSLNCG